MDARFKRRNERSTAQADGPSVRVNMTIPRDLLEAFKAHLAGAPLSTAVAEMMAKALSEK